MAVDAPSVVSGLSGLIVPLGLIAVARLGVDVANYAFKRARSAGGLSANALAARARSKVYRRERLARERAARRG